MDINKLGPISIIPVDKEMHRWPSPYRSGPPTHLLIKTWFHYTQHIVYVMLPIHQWTEKAAPDCVRAVQQCDLRNAIDSLEYYCDETLKASMQPETAVLFSAKG